jgi:uncharacterized membrane protein YphA (DoxX/SURF4 family)
MNVVLWIAQGLLALAFLMAGGMKLLRSKEQVLEAGQGWAEDFPAGVVKAIGVVEVLGALGLILPALTGILPLLTPLAAAGLVLDMVGAALTHARRSEVLPNVVVNTVLALIAAFVVYGRFVALPVA